MHFSVHYIYLLLIAAAAVVCADEHTTDASLLPNTYSVAHTSPSVVSNELFFRHASTWDSLIQEGNADAAYDAISGAMSADLVPWRVAVLHGDQWNYEWGFIVWQYAAFALSRNREKTRAYAALLSAADYMPSSPPPSPYDYYYWRWYSLMGELYVDFGRYFDAEHYFLHVRSSTQTNDMLYHRATERLAEVCGSTERFHEQGALLEEYFALAPIHSPRAWHRYTQTLFALGNFEAGCDALRTALRQCGLSPRYNENDYILRNARRYWQCFDRLDVFDWYMLLEEQLETLPLHKDSEELITLLITTRAMMRRIYPELDYEDKSDLMRVRSRLEAEKQQEASAFIASRKDVASRVYKSSPRATSPRAEQMYISSRDRDIDIENAINAVMYAAQRERTWRHGYVTEWEKILNTYDTQTLARIDIDGVNVLYLVYAQMGIIYADQHQPVFATNWLYKALSVSQNIRNTHRYADMHLWLAEMLLTRELFNPSEAAHHIAHALEHTTVSDGQRIWHDILHAQIARTNVTLDVHIQQLSSLVDRYGCALPQKVYERLARAYYRNGQHREAFNTVEKGFRRTLLKLPSRRNHFIAFFHAARSLHTREELIRYQALVREAALRLPANRQNAHAIADMLKKADEPWVVKQIRLAEIESKGNFTEDDWLFVSNAVLRSSDTRTAVLHVEAQAARALTETNIFDWKGWRRAWDSAREDFGIYHVRIHPGVRDSLHDMLLAVIEKYPTRLCTTMRLDLPDILADIPWRRKQGVIQALHAHGEEFLVSIIHMVNLERRDTFNATHPSYVYVRDFLRDNTSDEAQILRDGCVLIAQRGSHTSNLWLQLIH